MSRVSQGQSRPPAKTQGSALPSDPGPRAPAQTLTGLGVGGQVLSLSPSPRVTWPLQLPLLLWVSLSVNWDQ